MTGSDHKAPGLGEEDAALAAEYALGLLSGEALRVAERRVADEAAFRAEVTLWQGELAGLADGVAEIVPPARIKAEVQRRLFVQAAPAGWLARVMSRRGAMLGLGGAALAVLVISVSPRLFGPGAPELVAEMAAPDRSLVINARYADGQLAVERTAGLVAPGRVLELWLIVGDAAPISLGVVPDGATSVMELPEGLSAAITAGVILAVSDEPPGGSPTGQATGAVLALGEVFSG